MPFTFNPLSGKFDYYQTGGSGTVTSVASADGSITVTNPTTTVDLAVVKSPKLTTGRTISISGDLTYTSPTFDGTGNVTAAGTLATVNSNIGSFGSSTAIPSFTVNGKGLITAASTNVVIAPAGTLTGTTLNSTVVTSSLTTVGTIGTGVWQGTKIGLAFGGTNADLSATGGTSNYLKQSSSGAAITVGTIPASDIASGAALTKTDDTNVTLTLGGSPTVALLAATSLTLGWTGTLAVSRGGTGGGSASITLFNNITGYTASGATGTTSTNLVFSTSPTLTTPNIGVATAASVIYTNNAVTVASNAATVPVTSRLTTVTNNAAGSVTITMTTASATDGQFTVVRFYDFSAVAQTITWVNTENSTASVPLLSNGSTTLPVSVGFQYNGQTSKWRCLAVA